MSVVLQPTPEKGLVFIPNVAHGQRQTLTVRNDNTDPVAFKVKTTAPKQYCVRPNSGRIEPGQTTSILVQLQQFKGEIPVKCKDKFLILSAAIPPEFAQLGVAEFWTHVDTSPSVDKKQIVKEQKIRCSYASAEEGAATNGAEDIGVTGGAPVPITAAAVGSPSTPSKARDAEEDRYQTVRSTAPAINGSTISTAPAASTINGTDHATPSKANGSYDGVPASPAPAYEAPPAARAQPAPAQAAPAPTPTPAAPSSSSAAPAVGAAALGAGAGALGGAAVASRTNGNPSSTVTPATTTSPSTSEDVRSLEAKLKAAQAEIAKLQSELASKTKEVGDARDRERDARESALRQRKSSTNLRAQQNHQAEEKYLPAVAAKGRPGEQEGVPVQVVAGIAFGVFVFTWLFF